jgi:hypothetical protein
MNVEENFLDMQIKMIYTYNKDVEENFLDIQIRMIYTYKKTSLTCRSG